VLKCLERRAAGGIERDDLPVEQRPLGVQGQPGGADGRVGPGEILVVPRAECNPLAVLQQQGAVPVELDLVGPLEPFGQRRDGLGGHGRDKRGSRRLRLCHRDRSSPTRAARGKGPAAVLPVRIPGRPLGRAAQHNEP
jgi:hypothetical protein